MGLLNVWYTNFLGAQSHAVLPYAQQLHRFAAYLQQLTMESNGKSVRWDGTPVTTDTGEVFWGEPGTNGQHAFYQLIHQGTRLIPADFIAFVEPGLPARRTTGATCTGCSSRTSSRRPRRSRSARPPKRSRPRARPARSSPRARSPATGRRRRSSRRPSRRACSAQLVALYEHITFTQGVIWGINSFDQWGVELGKQLALQIAPALEGDATAFAAQDASTRALLEYYAAHREPERAPAQPYSSPTGTAIGSTLPGCASGHAQAGS